MNAPVRLLVLLAIAAFMLGLVFHTPEQMARQ